MEFCWGIKTQWTRIADYMVPSWEQPNIPKGILRVADFPNFPKSVGYVFLVP